MQDKLAILADLYGQQEKHYAHMRVLAKKMAGLCSSDTPEDVADLLQGLLDERQELILLIDKARGTALALLEELQDDRSAAEISEASLSRVEPVLSEIALLDAASSNALRDKMTAMKEQSRHLQTGRRAVAAYGGPRRQDEGFFIDSKIKS